MNTKVYEIVTDQIIDRLNAGVVPWNKPWKGESARPRNLVSKKAYRGLNSFLLAMSGYESPYYVSFKQAGDLGGNVKKGEHGNLVTFWKKLEVDDRNTGEKKEIMFMRYYRVFNLDQCEGIDEKKIPDMTDEYHEDNEPIEVAEGIVAGMPKPPSIVIKETNVACYRPAQDEVQMPELRQFENADSYYHTFFHELSHATGHASRLSREGVTIELAAFGGKTYSKEELVAEMSATFLASVAGIEPEFDNSAAYIANWLKVLKSDPKFVVQAASKAQKASDWILGELEEKVA